MESWNNCCSPQVILDDNAPRALQGSDIIIVCPYNAQVVMIRCMLQYWVLTCLVKQKEHA